MRSHLFYRWWQLKKHVVTGQKMTPLKVRCHRCTDDNVAFKLLSSPMTTLKPRCDLFTTLTTCLLSSDRSKDDTLKITSSSFTKDVTKTRCDLFWGQQRIFCVVILHRSCCIICVVIGTTDDTVIYAFTSPKRWHLWKYVLHGRWQLRNHVVIGTQMTTHFKGCHLWHRWQRGF